MKHYQFQNLKSKKQKKNKMKTNKKRANNNTLTKKGKPILKLSSLILSITCLFILIIGASVFGDDSNSDTNPCEGPNKPSWCEFQDYLESDSEDLEDAINKLPTSESVLKDLIAHNKNKPENIQKLWETINNPPSGETNLLRVIKVQDFMTFFFENKESRDTILRGILTSTENSPPEEVTKNIKNLWNNLYELTNKDLQKTMEIKDEIIKHAFSIAQENHLNKDTKQEDKTNSKKVFEGIIASVLNTNEDQDVEVGVSSSLFDEGNSIDYKINTKTGKERFLFYYKDNFGDRELSLDINNIPPQTRKIVIGEATNHVGEGKSNHIYFIDDKGIPFISYNQRDFTLSVRGDKIIAVYQGTEIGELDVSSGGQAVIGKNYRSVIKNKEGKYEKTSDEILSGIRVYGQAKFKFSIEHNNAYHKYEITSSNNLLSAGEKKLPYGFIAFDSKDETFQVTKANNAIVYLRGGILNFRGLFASESPSDQEESSQGQLLVESTSLEETKVVATTKPLTEEQKKEIEIHIGIVEDIEPGKEYNPNLLDPNREPERGKIGELTINTANFGDKKTIITSSPGIPTNLIQGENEITFITPGNLIFHGKELHNNRLIPQVTNNNQENTPISTTFSTSSGPRLTQSN
jgi:hypothetical protein